MLSDDSRRPGESIPEPPPRSPLLPWFVDGQNESGPPPSPIENKHSVKTAPGLHPELPPLPWLPGEQVEPNSASSSIYSQNSDKLVPELPPRLPPLQRLSYEHGELDSADYSIGLPAMSEQSGAVCSENESFSPVELPNTMPVRREARVLESIDEETVTEVFDVHDLASTLAYPSDKTRTELVLVQEERDDEDQSEEEVDNDPSPDTAEITLSEALESGMNAETPPQVQEQEAAEDGFMTGAPLWFLMTGLMLGMLIISMDRTIISTVRCEPFIRLLPLADQSHPGYPIHHASIRVDARHWVVWLGLSAHGMRLPARVWAHLHAVLDQKGVPDGPVLV